MIESLMIIAGAVVAVLAALTYVNKERPFSYAFVGILAGFGWVICGVTHNLYYGAIASMLWISLLLLTIKSPGKHTH